MIKHFILVAMLLSTTVVAEAARQGVVDDAFSWFEAVNGQALGGNNIPYSTGWYLKSFVRIFGEYPNRRV